MNGDGPRGADGSVAAAAVPASGVPAGADDPTGAAPVPVAVDVHLAPGAARHALVADVRAGLLAPPGEKRLPPVWFYDDRGSALFDAITELPEYYPTRAERRLLQAHAGDVASAAKAATMVELGAGTCHKSRILIGALRQAGCLERYVPLDVSEATLRQASEALAADYPGLAVHAVVGDFHHHLDRLPTTGRTLVAFLGGTIGNLLPDDRRRFLADLDRRLQAGDSLLLGTDLVKDAGTLVAAYDDAAGVTAEFNRNVLSVLNRELRGDLAVDGFEHVARWDPDEQWIEMRLRARGPQRATLAAIDAEVAFEDGEELLTEISAKFTRERVEAELWEAGFVVDGQWGADEGEFLLTLAHPFC